MAPSGISDNLARLAKAATLAILLASAGLTAWIWWLPQSLPAAQTWGERQANAFAEARVRQTAKQQGAQGAAQTASNLETWKAKNSAPLKRIAQKAEKRFRDQFTYRAADGREHIYLGDLDSYYWLHFARKLLRSGQLCDLGEAGRCLDAHGHAPVGAPLAYPYSLHIFSIAALHSIITTVRPLYPLDATAKLLPVIVAVLGVVPAFFIGRLLAGTLGGLIAAVTIVLHPLILERGLGGDNDVWNLVMPLYMVWAATAAMSGGLWRRITFAVFAAAVAGLHATIWQGWMFAYFVVAAGLLGYLAFQTANAVRDTRSWRVWRCDGVQGVAQTLVIFYIATGLFATLAGAGDSYMTIPLKALESVANSLFDTASQPAAGALAWPDVFESVSELRNPDLVDIADNLGGDISH
jgi:hypothetical protein